MGEAPPIKIKGTDFPLPADWLLEGIPLGEIASSHKSGPKNELSYDDIIDAFALPTDIYTPDTHDRLVAAFLSNTSGDLFFKDIVSSSIRSRPLLKPEDLSPSLQCELVHGSLPSTGVGFDIFIGFQADKNHAQANGDTPHLWEHYLMVGTWDFTGQLPFAPATAGLSLVLGLLHDVDAARVSAVQNHFLIKGCADPRRDRECVTLTAAMTKGQATEALSQNPSCKNFLEDVACFGKVIARDLLKQEEELGTDTDTPLRIMGDRLKKYRESNKNNTYTSLARALILEQIISGRLGAFGLSSSVKTALIVGPGLEWVCPSFGLTTPQQTYEPFAVINALLASARSDVRDFRLDTVDISSRVTDHLKEAVKQAKADQPYFLYLAWKGNQPIPFGTSFDPSVRENIGGGAEKERQELVGVPPDAVRLINPLEGDIITDRIAAEGEYDLIVMMNTFLYFSPTERLIALDNLGRLLNEGGILLTDIGETDLVVTPDCQNEEGRITPAGRINFSVESYLPPDEAARTKFVVWKKTSGWIKDLRR